ncbi:MAG: hypothetical protein II825_05285 [Paludibacteraceae bacterium]|nr:hypothetical protein [Paludibacteraceae bacterium]MBQ6723424.1 hypothetical protein [Paludibacteraceae bacterium]MBR4565168.1 hypothetical protein [Paludibacteraceae bacterium]
MRRQILNLQASALKSPLLGGGRFSRFIGRTLRDILPVIVATTSRTITTRWPMLKPAQ